MEEAKLLQDYFEELVATFGLIGALVAFVLLLTISGLLLFYTQRIKSLAAKGVEEALQKHQKSLELAFSEDAVKNALKIEVGKISIQKKLEVWEEFYELTNRHETILQEARQQNRLLALTYQETEPPFFAFSSYLSQNEIYLGRDLASKIQGVLSEYQMRTITYVKCFGYLNERGFPQEHYQDQLVKHNQAIRQSVADITQWLQANLYTPVTALDYENKLETTMKFHDMDKLDQPISESKPSSNTTDRSEP